MTIIATNYNDVESLVTPTLWNGLTNVKLIQLTNDMIDTYEDIVDNAISEEDDTIIFIGHGTPHGLLFPNSHTGVYVFHENNLHLLHAKKVIGIWCHASSFAENHNVKGFFTSMFISNVNEAYDYCVPTNSQKDIDSMHRTFLQRVRYLIDNNIPLEEWTMFLGGKMNIEDAVEVFNYQGLFYNAK